MRKSRSLHRERGLKYLGVGNSKPEAMSLPSQGAWIEIIIDFSGSSFFFMSLPSQGAWIEILHSMSFLFFLIWCRSLHRERGLKSF